jgi:hypothetical protein
MTITLESEIGIHPSIGTSLYYFIKEKILK